MDIILQTKKVIFRQVSKFLQVDLQANFDVLCDTGSGLLIRTVDGAQSETERIKKLDPVMDGLGFRLRHVKEFENPGRQANLLRAKDLFTY